MTTIPTTTDVVIVGAGPTGLAVALTLARADVSFVLIDERAERSTTSRAAVIHAGTMEVFERLDLVDTFIERGLAVTAFSMRHRDRRMASLSFAWLPTKYPFMVMLPQCDTEAILLAALRTLGHEPYRSVRVTDVDQSNTGARTTIDDTDGASQVIRSRYVVGADGVHSTVREATGIDFSGAPYEDSFVLADVALEWTLPHDEGYFFGAEQGLAVVVPLPDDRYRIIATATDPPEEPDADYLGRLLRSRGPSGSIEVTDVAWSSRFRLQRRVAERFRTGRVLLAGDAAHTHSPAGARA